MNISCAHMRTIVGNSTAACKIPNGDQKRNVLIIFFFFVLAKWHTSTGEITTTYKSMTHPIEYYYDKAIEL